VGGGGRCSADMELLLKKAAGLSLSCDRHFTFKRRIAIRSVKKCECGDCCCYCCPYIHSMLLPIRPYQHTIPESTER